MSQHSDGVSRPALSAKLPGEMSVLTRRDFVASSMAGSIAFAFSSQAEAQAAAKTLRVGTVTLGSGSGLIWKTSSESSYLPGIAEESLLIASPQGGYQPGLAKEFTMSDDGRTVTFKLNQGVQFHDGKGELTSADVKFAIEKMSVPGSPSISGPVFKEVIESVETPDPYTVIVKVKPGKETFDFLFNFSSCPPRFQVTSQSYVNNVGEDVASRKWVGTGPWKLESLKSGDSAQFSAVKNHWRRTPVFDTLIIKEIPDSATQKLMLRAGDLDIIPCSVDSVQELKDAGFKIISSRGHPHYIYFGGIYLPSREGFNPKLPWVADPADAKAWEKSRLVRLAMNFAVDKDAIFKAILGGVGEASAVPDMVPSHPGYDPSWKPYPYDVSRAKDLLKEAGYANGFSCVVRQYRLPGRDGIYDIATVLPAYLEKIGIEAKIEQVDYTTVMAQQQRARKLSCLGVYATGREEALTAWTITGTSVSSACWLPETAWLDEKIALGMRTINKDARMKITREIGKYYIDNAATIPIGSQDTTFAVNPDKVKNWTLPPSATAPLTNLEMIG